MAFAPYSSYSMKLALFGETSTDISTYSKKQYKKKKKKNKYHGKTFCECRTLHQTTRYAHGSSGEVQYFAETVTDISTYSKKQ